MLNPLLTLSRTPSRDAVHVPQIVSVLVEIYNVREAAVQKLNLLGPVPYPAGYLAFLAIDCNTQIAKNSRHKMVCTAVTPSSPQTLGSLAMAET